MSTADYLAKSKVLDTAKLKAAAIARTIIIAGNAMEHWQKMVVSGTEVLFPTSAGFNNRTVNISENTWPTPKQIAEAFGEYHRAFDAAQTAWTNIQPEDRPSGLAAPTP